MGVHRYLLCAAAVLSLVAPAAPAGADTLVINRDDYADRLAGMWLGECIANWTGLMTEGAKQNAPFYTDAAWGTASVTNGFVGKPIGFNFQAPWRADDDTDVEYAYVHLMSQAQNPLLTTQQLTAGWQTHFTQALFYSNGWARALLNVGVSAEATGLPAANPYSHHIDAQLTTEVFGALAPGRPDQGMRYGMAPMLMTSRGHATHASQYFNAMYSLAAAVPSDLSPAQKMRWLHDEAAKYIPPTSKVTDIINFVTNDFEQNPDINNWESTRDKIHERYRRQAAANGFWYRDWVESSINLGAGVIALLYGNGDYKRTVQIATLSGWDSDNATASLGGLFGLVHGKQHIIDQFTAGDFIDRGTMTPVSLTEDFRATSSGLSNMPDHVPTVANVDDTFTLLANRMKPIIDQAVLQMGGTVDAASNTWTIPLLDVTDAQKLALSPTQQLMNRSANNVVRAAGGNVVAASSATGQASADTANLPLIADGFEHDFRGIDYNPLTKDLKWYSTVAPGNTASTDQWLGVAYSQSVWASQVRFIEGDTQTSAGGSFQNIRLELLIDGTWVPAPPGTTLDEPLNASARFQILDFNLPAAMQVSGVRLLGASGSSTFAVSAAELDAFLAPVLYWDVNGTTPGAGGPLANGKWDGAAVRFNTDPAGGAAGAFTAATSSTDIVVFSAGSDASTGGRVFVGGTQSAGQVRFEDGSMTLHGDGTLAAGDFDVAAGAGAIIDVPVTGGVLNHLTKTGPGTLTLTSTTHTGPTDIRGGTVRLRNGLKSTGSLAIADGASLVIPAAAPATYNPALNHYPSGQNATASIISSLTMTGAAQLDLGNNDLAIDYTSDSPLIDIRALLASGYNFGNQDGAGIISSTALNTDPFTFTLGYAENASLPIPYGTAIGLGTPFAGFDVDDTAVLIKFTWVGDVTLDGVLDFQDLSIFNGNYDAGATTGRVWTDGDLNYDGTIDFQDLSLFNGTYDPSKPSLPEPAVLSLLAPFAMGLRRRSRPTRHL